MKHECGGCLEISNDPAAHGWEMDYAIDKNTPHEEDAWLCRICITVLLHDPDALLPVFSFNDETIKKARLEGVSMWEIVK